MISGCAGSNVGTLLFFRYFSTQGWEVLWEGKPVLPLEGGREGGSTFQILEQSVQSCAELIYQELVFCDCDISFPFPTQVFYWEQNIALNPSPPPPLLSSPPRPCCQPTPRQAAETAAPRQTEAVSRAKLLPPLQLPPQHDSPAPT